MLRSAQEEEMRLAEKRKRKLKRTLEKKEAHKRKKAARGPKPIKIDEKALEGIDPNLSLTENRERARRMHREMEGGGLVFDVYSSAPCSDENSQMGR